MANYIEEIIGNGFEAVVGDPAIQGIIFLGFFTTFVFLQGTRLDFKVAILVPACFLALVFIPWFSVILALFLGALLYLAIMKFISK